ncbi:MAG: hypothetical protein Q9224_003999 [Gallowayella concinna]
MMDITLTASQSYVPPFGTQSEEYLLGPRQPTRSQDEPQIQQQQQQSNPSNPRKRKAPEPTPMAGIPSGYLPGYGSPSDFAAPGQQGEQQPEVPTQGSTPKKSRTNTPWTPAEEQRLKTMRDAGNTWSEIAKVRFSIRSMVENMTDTEPDARHSPIEQREA